MARRIAKCRIERRRWRRAGTATRGRGNAVKAASSLSPGALTVGYTHEHDLRGRRAAALLFDLVYTWWLRAFMAAAILFLPVACLAGWKPGGVPEWQGLAIGGLLNLLGWTTRDYAMKAPAGRRGRAALNGKRLFRLALVDVRTGAPASLPTCMLRGLVFLVAWPLIAVQVLGGRARHLADEVASTVVVADPR